MNPQVGYFRISSLVPGLLATAAWLLLYGITTAVEAYEGVQNMEVLFSVVGVVVSSVAGASVGSLLFRNLMRHGTSLGRRLVSAVASSVLAIIAAFVVGATVAHFMDPDLHNDLGCFIAACIAVCVAGPTGLVFGFTGGTFKKQIPVARGFPPSKPSEDRTGHSLAGDSSK
jgi:hypothetical protein